MASNFELLNITGNPSTQQYMKDKVDGKQMSALRLKRITEIQRTAALGIAKPCTVLNFNPVPLRLEGGIPWKVPSIVDTAVADENRLEFKYKNRTFRATVQTIREPHFYPWIVDVSKRDGDDMADGVGIFDIRVCKQIEIAHDFWQDYNEGTFNSVRMGGVVIFEGDKHALKSNLIQVPEFMRLPDGSREYFCQPQPFSEVMAKALDTQKVYYDGQMLTGSSYWNDPDQRKNITNIHLVWAQYGLDMGYRENPVEWQISVDEPEGSCGGCGAGKKRALAYFCHACARPYDPLRAYLDKELGIDSVHMQRIPDEDFHLVVEEEKRRKARYFMLHPEPAAPAESKVESKPAKQGKAKPEEPLAE